MRSGGSGRSGWRERAGFLPEEGEEEGKFVAGAVFGAGSGAGLALFVGVPFFEVAEAEAGIESGFHEFFEAAVEGDGVLALFLARVHDDGDAEGAGVGVEAAVLDFAFFIEAPGGLAGDAEAGVIEGPEEASARAEDGGCGGGGFGEVLDVLEAEDGGGGVEGAEVVEGGGVANEEAAAGAGVGAGFVDEGGGGVNAGGAGAFGGDGAGEDALAAAEVEVGFVFGGVEECE